MDIITILDNKKKYIKMLYAVGLIVLLLDVFLIFFLVYINDGFSLGWVFGILLVWFLQIVLFILEIICLINFSYSKNRGYTVLLIINIVGIMISLFLNFFSLQVGDLLSLVTLIILIITTIFIFQIRGIYKQIDTVSMSTNQPYAQYTQSPGSISEQNINQTQYSNNQMYAQNMNPDNAIIDLNNLTPEQKEQLLIMLLQNNQKN